MVAVTVDVAVSMTETELPTKLATYAWLPSGVNAMPSGWLEVGTLAVIVSVLVLITSIPPTAGPRLRSHPTYRREPSGETATTSGTTPTGMVAVTVSVAASITDTLLLPSLAV